MRIALLALLLAAACETDEHKAARLRSDVSIACRAAEAMVPLTHGAYSYTEDDRVKQQAKCDAAKRRWAQFQAGKD